MIRTTFIYNIKFILNTIFTGKQTMISDFKVDFATSNALSKLRVILKTI